MSAENGLGAAVLRFEEGLRAFGELSQDQYGPAVRRFSPGGMRAR